MNSITPKENTRLLRNWLLSSFLAIAFTVRFGLLFEKVVLYGFSLRDVLGIFALILMVSMSYTLCVSGRSINVVLIIFIIIGIFERL